MTHLFVRPLVAAAVTAGVAVLLRLFRHLIERATPKRPGESRLPSLVGATGMLSGAVAGLILSMGLLGPVTPERRDFGAWMVLMLGFAAGGLITTVAAGNWRMWRTEAGIQIRNELGVTKPLIPWSRIARVRRTSVIAFELHGGGQLKVPFRTAGLLEAVKAAQAHGAALDAELAAACKSGVKL